MLSGAILGVGVSVAGTDAFTTTEGFFNTAVAFRAGVDFFVGTDTFLAGNDFLDDVAFLPTVDALFTGAEALRVRFIFGAFSNDSSDPLQSESPLSRLKSSSELLLLM